MDRIIDSANVNATMKRWVELYSDAMYSWVFYKTSDKETAEDIVQETFLAALQSFAGFEGKSNPKTWLFAILNNKIIEYYRKKYKNPVILESQYHETEQNSFFDSCFNDNGMWKKEERPQKWEGDTEHILDNIEFRMVMQHCMSKLPSNWFTTIQLKYMEEKSSEQICQDVGITPTNFWQILHRAKVQLRKCLELHWFKK